MNSLLYWGLMVLLLGSMGSRGGSRSFIKKLSSEFHIIL